MVRADRRHKTGGSLTIATDKIVVHEACSKLRGVNAFFSIIGSDCVDE